MKSDRRMTASASSDKLASIERKGTRLILLAAINLALCGASFAINLSR